MPAIEFERSQVVAADPQHCWSVYTDVPKLVTWVTVLDEAKEISHLETYTAVLADRVGPFKLKADLDIKVSEVVPGEHIRVRADGKDRQVASRIMIDAVLSTEPQQGGGTLVRATGSYEVVGIVATMGASMIVTKANKILDEFFGHSVAELGDPGMAGRERT
jgi:carbon monoxide dehydrogenase subunit G